MSKAIKRTPNPKAVTRLTASAKTIKSVANTVQKTMHPQSGGQRNLNKEIRHVDEFDAQKADNRLKKKSAWIASIMDPLRGAGAKIPDAEGIPTACSQLVQKITVPVNAGGVCACEVVTPYVTSSASKNYRFSNAASVSTNLTWAAPEFFSNQTTLQSIASSHRVVSGALYAEYEGTTLQDSGDVTTYTRAYTPQALTALSAIQSTYTASVVPINKARSKAVMARWFPININAQSYKDFVGTNFSGIGSPGATPFWTLGAVFSGLPASVGSVIFTFVFNYEFVPTLNSMDFITPENSPVDPFEEQFAVQWAQQEPSTGITSNKKVDVSPSSQVVQAADQGMSADNMFGMLGQIIKEVVPLLALL